jgi:membrane carboxypeptidase/penicillin-binding protein PbpC
MYHERIYDILWSELGGSGVIRMRPIAFELFRYLVMNDSEIPVSLRVCETATTLLLQRQKPHRKKHYSQLELTAICLWLNHHWTARQTLSFIADQSYFGHGVVGITDASQTYFGKRSEELEIEEMTVLVAIRFKPAVHDPWCHPENSLQRTNLILEKLHSAMPEKYPLKQLVQLPDTLLASPDRACNNNNNTQ